MQKSKVYWQCHFAAEVIRDSSALLDGEAAKAGTVKESEYSSLTVEVDKERWSHESIEEFLADYRRTDRFQRRVIVEVGDTRSYYYLEIEFFRYFDGRCKTDVSVQAPDRETIEKLFANFESVADGSMEPEPVPDETISTPTIFIGHGHSPAWRDLKDHLHELHGYIVEAYETGARAGHVIRDILQDMSSKSNFAILVMTGDELDSEGSRRARQNVVHEIGLFQGKLGFERATVLVEEGVEEFSNLQGIQQIRFPQGRIRETFGDVLATLRREFGDGR